MTKIFALGEEHKMEIIIRLKSDNFEKIFTQLVPQDQMAIRAFLGTIHPIQCWALGYTKLIWLLTCLIGKLEWRQTKSEELASQILYQVYVIKTIIFGEDFILFIDLYLDIFNFATRYNIT